VAFNWGLARVKAVMDQRAAEASYGIIAGDLTPPISWSLYSLRKDWNTAKDRVAPWWAECSKEAYSTGLNQLAQALQNWADSRNGRRKGRSARFPRFRSKRKARLSVRWTTGSFRCEARHAILPRIGRIKLHEDGRRLADLVAAGTARVLSVTVRFARAAGSRPSPPKLSSATRRPAARTRPGTQRGRLPGRHLVPHRRPGSVRPRWLPCRD
jgi:putative transposase